MSGSVSAAARECAVGERRREWPGLLTNHGQALLCLLREPSLRIRDVSERIGTSERRAQAIVNDLVEAGLIRRRRVGRRNHYDVPPTGEHDAGAPVRELGSALERARAGEPARAC